MVQWFQYKPGAVGETQRVAHYAAPFTGDGYLRSLCQREFESTQVDEVAEPGAEPHGQQARPNAPCVPCLLLAMARTQTRESTELDQPGETVELISADSTSAPAIPALPESASALSEGATPRRERAALAVFLRKAQWLLDDAAHQVPGNRYSPEQAAELAEALEELASLVRETLFNPVATEV